MFYLMVVGGNLFLVYLLTVWQGEQMEERIFKIKTDTKIISPFIDRIQIKLSTT